MFHFSGFSGFSGFDGVAGEVMQRAKHIGFGKNNSHVKKIEQQYEDEDDKTSLILDSTLRRYSILSYRATDCGDYNANEIAANIWIGEGPYRNTLSENGNYNNIPRFCHSILRNSKICFTTVVALGPSCGKNRVNFTPYLSPNLNPDQSETKTLSRTTTKGRYCITTKPIETEQDDFHLYSMKLTRKEIFQKELALVHLPQMQDMGTLETSEQLIHQLILLANKSKEEAIFIHCSAGLGRSGTIALALTLFLRYEELSKINNKNTLVDAIVSLWDKFNEIRPGTIQNAEQLGNALQIADEMSKLKLRLDEDNVLALKEKSSKSSKASSSPSFLTSRSPRLFVSLSDENKPSNTAPSSWDEDSSQSFVI